MKRLRRFWLLGVGSAVLFYHSNGVLAGDYAGFRLVPYDTAVFLGVGEFFFAIILSSAFFIRLVVWWHDHPRELRSFVDDPGIID